MDKKILIDASQPEETRVVVSNGDQIDEFHFESNLKKPTRGNIYLAKVVRIEPSLQAAFVSYGGERHGFLAFNDIHPDYYQIPLADREAILAEQAEAQARADARERAEFGDETESENNRTDGTDSTDSTEEGADSTDSVDGGWGIPSRDAGGAEQEFAAQEGNGADMEQDGDTDAFNDVSNDAPNDEHDGVAESSFQRERRGLPRLFQRRYNLQEVIKNRQILLVQVVKEERGSKGAALTTYLSLAGRYCVLMPNTERGSGISRKITHGVQRKNLRAILDTLELPKGMGLIVRTAGAKRTKTEIRRDCEYLLRLWENVRDLTLKSAAPSLIYEDGDLIKRSIRDLYGKGVNEVVVEGEAGHQDAKAFMRVLTPSHVKNVHLHKDRTPIFQHYGVESELRGLLQPEVLLKSGGSLVIEQTEALAAIDVNSGRATREYDVESTALKTNLEATEEAARQMRLRDLSGLIVIDYIDMMEAKNRRIVESRLKECLKSDRARYQVGSISEFGLLELSRQRMRTGILEGSSRICPHCRGLGKLLSVEAASLRLLRAIRTETLTARSGAIMARAPGRVAFYILNHKRAVLHEMRQASGADIILEEKIGALMDDFLIERVAAGSERRRGDNGELATAAQAEQDASASSDRGRRDEASSSRRRSRRSRGGRGRGRAAAPAGANAAETESQDGADAAEAGTATGAETQETGARDARHNGSRGSRGGRHARGRRHSPSGGGTDAESGAQQESGEMWGSISSAAAAEQIAEEV